MDFKERILSVVLIMLFGILFMDLFNSISHIIGIFFR